MTTQAEKKPGVWNKFSKMAPASRAWRVGKLAAALMGTCFVPARAGKAGVGLAHPLRTEPLPVVDLRPLCAGRGKYYANCGRFFSHGLRVVFLRSWIGGGGGGLEVEKFRFQEGL